MARPVVIDREAANLIASILQIPQPIETACAAAGVSERTFYRWQSEGKKAERKEGKSETLTDSEKEFLQFWHTTKKARAVGKVALLNVISKVANDATEPKRWQAAAWMLERMYPREFGRRYIKIEAGGPENDDGTPAAGGGAGFAVNVTFEGGKPEAPKVIGEAPPDETPA